VTGSQIPSALVPVYPFGPPGEPISLHNGAIRFGGEATSGILQLRLLPSPQLSWKIHSRRVARVGADEVPLSFDHSSGPVRFTGHLRGFADGWMNSIEIGPTDAELDRVLVHWLNLPAIRGSYWIASAGGGRYTGRGRPRLAVGR
jgi:hypothetical protein